MAPQIGPIIKFSSASSNISDRSISRSWLFWINHLGYDAGANVAFRYQWIAQYGYFGIFVLLGLGIVGLPIPDEALLMFVGYSVYRGRLQPLPVLVSAFLGIACGISLSYALDADLDDWSSRILTTCRVSVRRL